MFQTVESRTSERLFDIGSVPPMLSGPAAGGAIAFRGD